ncbi:hypothetical protein IWX88_000287 [Frigoribacterium sp. CG_9.8]|nr:hypothetical protein [Frigoribacterium sp. CG_9.8]
MRGGRGLLAIALIGEGAAIGAPLQISVPALIALLGAIFGHLGRPHATGE